MYLQKCLSVGERFSKLLAGYHDLLATEASERDAQLQELTEEHRLLNEWLHREFQFDFTDPKGGDQAAWLEALEMLRVRLEEMRAL